METKNSLGLNQIHRNSRTWISLLH